MKTKITLISNLLFLVIFAAACGSQTATPTVSHDRPVEDYVSLVDSLRGAGAKVGSGDEVEQVFFTVTGQVIKVNGADVQVFEYETAKAMEADAAQVAPDGGSIGTNMVMWVEAPHFYEAGRILVLYVGEDRAILDVLNSALGPQFAGH